MSDEQRHETVLDIGHQQLGEVYANALIGAADADPTTEAQAVVEELQAFVSEVLNKVDGLEKTLASRRVSHEVKESLLDKAIGTSASKVTLNFLKVVSKHERMDALRSISAAAHKQLNAQQGRIAVTVTTADAVDGTALENIQSKLEEKLGSKVDIQAKVDPTLIGGTVIRVGDTLYDGSVANRLKKIRSSAKENTIRQIRLETERFTAAQ